MYVSRKRVVKLETKTLLTIILLLIGFAIVVLLILFFKSQAPQTGINTVGNWSWANII